MTDIAEFFLGVDSTVMLGINGLHTPVLDTVMHTVSMRTVWIPLYLFLFFMIWRTRGWKSAVLCLVTVGLAVGVADQLCGSWLRHLVGRLRPSNPDNPLSQWVHIVNNHRGGKYGFPSCHAANTAVVATVVSLWMRRRVITVSLFSWAALVSLSRIFIGVHYPGDVTAGFLVGMLIAYIVLRLLYLSVSRARRTWPRLGIPLLLR